MRALRALCSQRGFEAEATSPESVARFSPGEPIAVYGQPEVSERSDRVLEFQH
jgi:hypothetical protein